MGGRSFMLATPALWNNLFLPIRQAETLILLNVYLILKYSLYIYIDRNELSSICRHSKKFLLNTAIT